MLRTPLASERIQRVDATTGIKVIQLTSYPLPSAHLTYDWPSITPDTRRVILFCQRNAARDSPWDMFRVDSDGLNLYQLTEKRGRMEAGGYYGRPASRLALDGRTVYSVWGKSLCTVDVETGDAEDLVSIEGACPPKAVIGSIHLSADGRSIFANCRGPGGTTVVRVDLGTGETSGVEVGGYLFACDPTGPRLIVDKGAVEWGTVLKDDGSRVVTNQGQLLGKWITDEDGNDVEYLSPEIYAHATLLGNQVKVQGCGRMPNRCVLLTERGREPRKIAEGPYFWHSSASYSGEWVVADTNWPDEGIQLVHVPTGHFGTLCHAGASQDHYEFGHPHPFLSQDGSLCVYRSDKTGVPQIYAAHIPAGFRKRIISGELGSGASGTAT
jgi:hypothetical protein